MSLTETPAGGTQAFCTLRHGVNVCGRPEGHAGACYDETTRVTFEDGWFDGDRCQHAAGESKRGRVERLDGYTNGDLVGSRPTVTWRVYLDGRHLGNAYSEPEGWAWVEDVLKMPQPWWLICEPLPGGTS